MVLCRVFKRFLITLNNDGVIGMGSPTYLTRVFSRHTCTRRCYCSLWDYNGLVNAKTCCMNWRWMNMLARGGPCGWEVGDCTSMCSCMMLLSFHGFCNSAEPRYPRTLIELCLTLIQRDDCSYVKQTGIALECQKVGFYSVIWWDCEWLRCT